MTPIRLDHIAVTGESLAAAVAHVENLLGVPMAPGGRHGLMGTHNRLLSLGDGTYLEAIAPDPDARAPERPRWFGLDHIRGPARLGAWIVRGGAEAAIPEATGPALAMSRGDLSWTLTVRDDGALPWAGAMPAHIEWGPGGHPAERLPASGCRLMRLEVAHPQARRILAEWPGLLALRNVRIGPGPAPALRAEIMTPHGLRFLE